MPPGQARRAGVRWEITPTIREIGSCQTQGHEPAVCTESPGPLMAGCAFCSIIAGDLPAVLIDESPTLVSLLDHRPLFRGHVLLVPRVHVRTLADLPAELVPEFFLEAQRLERAVEAGLSADGSLILINNVVSQSVPHLHLHVIPRHRRDGLRFWLGPRHPYNADHPAEAYAARIRAALPPRL